MDGYIYAASKHQKYVTSALYSAGTLRDYHPEAHITLYTEEEFLDSSLLDVFDNVVTEGAPSSKRLKLWALARTPYEKTLYIDADSAIQHADISKVFDELGDRDLMITKIRPYNGAFVYFPGGKLEDHCGVFLYNNKPHTIKFMQEWWNLWQKQESGEWKWDTSLYPDKELRPWDQWSYWWLMNKTDNDIDRGYFDNDARWNYVNGYIDECKPEDIVIYHHTVRLK